MPSKQTMVLGLALAIGSIVSAALWLSRKAQAREKKRFVQDIPIITDEKIADMALPDMASQIVEICEASCCVVLRYEENTPPMVMTAAVSGLPLTAQDQRRIGAIAEEAGRRNEIIGTNPSADWKCIAMGIAFPLHVQNTLWGALYVGPRQDGLLFSAAQQRLIVRLSQKIAQHASMTP